MTTNLPSDHKAKRRFSLAWLGRVISVLCAVGLVTGAGVFVLGACQFEFGPSAQGVSQGLDTMSYGVLAALIAVTAYVGFFAFGFLIANLFDQQDMPGRA